MFTVILALVIQITPPNLPEPVTNNAVASLQIDGRWYAYSFLGLDDSKRWDGVHPRSFEWVEGRDQWHAIPAPTGPGRLAGTAQVHGDKVYLFGGYTVEEDGSERSVPNVDIWDPRSRNWSRGADIPVPTDDAVSGVWRDSLIYLVSGWHNTGNISNVQIYDPALDRWTQGTPIPGTPVFGHTGGIVGDAILYIDGAGIFPDSAPRFRLVHESWKGTIDPDHPQNISWVRLESHPGPPVYRGAAYPWGDAVIIVGGSDNAYNYNGMGYDRQRSEPTGKLFGYYTAEGWIDAPGADVETMDHRGLIEINRVLYTVGGMGGGQRVTNRVIPLREIPTGSRN
jgi:hypothetical protein